MKCVADWARSESDDDRRCGSSATRYSERFGPDTRPITSGLGGQILTVAPSPGQDMIVHAPGLVPASAGSVRFKTKFKNTPKLCELKSGV